MSAAGLSNRLGSYRLIPCLSLSLVIGDKDTDLADATLCARIKVDSEQKWLCSGWL